MGAESQHDEKLQKNENLRFQTQRKNEPEKEDETRNKKKTEMFRFEKFENGLGECG